MATTLRFENRSAGTTVDLLAGLELQAGSWRQGYDSGDGKITDTFRLIAPGTRAAARALVNSLDDILQDAFTWHDDKLEADSIWLRYAAEGESAKRALASDYKLTVEDDPVWDRRQVNNEEVIVGLAVTRKGEWESPTATTASTSTSVTADADQWDQTSLSGGKRDGRLAMMKIIALDDIRRMWIGIKPTRGSSLSTFVSAYECEDGATTNLTNHDTSVVGSVTGASGSSVMETTFATETGMNWRFFLDPFDTGMDEDDGRGRYRMLVRCRIVNGSGGDVDVAVRGSVSWVSPAYDSPVAMNETRYLTKSEHGTSWRILDLGEIQIPPRVYRGPFADGDVNVLELSLNIEAALLEGTANSDKVQWDSIYLVPAEHFFYWDEATIYGTGAQAGYIFAYEDDEVDAYVGNPLGSNQILDAPAPAPTNWVWPKDGGLVVWVGERDTEHDYTDAAGIDIEVYQRWGVFRE